MRALGEKHLPVLGADQGRKRITSGGAGQNVWWIAEPGNTDCHSMVLLSDHVVH